VPIPLLRAHAVARTQCACQKFVLDQHRDHELTCKKHTGAIAGHDHVINVSAQLACNSGLRVRIIRKVATTAVDSNKQGDVQAMEFGIPGYDDLVCDVSLVCYRIGSSTQHGLNGTTKLKLGDYLFFLSGLEDPIQSLVHPINYLTPKKLSRTGGQGAYLYLEKTLRVHNLVGKTVHNVGGLACILGLTNPHDQSP